jgi:hypothetical protein
MVAPKYDVVYKSTTIKVKTPDGTLFVDVLEDNDGKPFKLLARIGKSGSMTMAWVEAVAALASIVLEAKGLDFTISELYNIRSDRTVVTSIVRNRAVEVRSGPEGFAYALSVYKRDKYNQLKDKLGIDDEEDDTDFYRGPSTRLR